jgi:ankyrin repeat protein
MDPAKTNDANLKLIAAARWGSETQVQEALSSGGVNKNYKEKTGYGYTPLHSAVHSNTRVAWVLIQDAGVRVNAKTNLGHTPLHFGWRQCVDAMLLSGKLVLWNVEDKIGQTPLLYHARIVNDVNLSGLLKLGVERVKMEDIKTKDGFTVLHQVVERGSPFPNWYKEEHHSPQLRCKVVGLLLDELKRRASEKQKILDVLERRAAEEKKKGEYELERKTAKEKLSRKDEVERTAAKEKQKREDELERTKQSAKNEQNESQRKERTRGS